MFRFICLALSGYPSQTGVMMAVLLFTCYGCDSGLTPQQHNKPVTTLPNPPAPSNPYVVDIVIESLDFPASVNFAPDGTLFILERGNYDNINKKRYPPRLKHLDLGTGIIKEIEGMPTADITIAKVKNETFNGGALGLELDPDFANNGQLYICYHYLADPDDDSSEFNRLSSFVINNDRLTNERVLVDRVPGGNNHNGCRVIMGPDRNLYYSTGVGGNSNNAQDLASMAGKILRIRPDGSIPPDNPFPGSPVWSYGHRNPQGLAFEPSTETLWSTEHGPNTNDELNLIEAGMNYGWPYCAGEVRFGSKWVSSIVKDRKWWQFWKKKYRYRICKADGLNESVYRPAVKSYYPDQTVGISDLVFYSGTAFPDWDGNLFFVILKTGRLIRVILDGNRIEKDEMLIAGDESANYGRLRDVTVSPDGYLYVVTNVTNPGMVETARPKNPRGGLLLRIRPAE